LPTLCRRRDCVDTSLPNLDDARRTVPGTGVADNSRLESVMATCSVCGNEYDKTFQITAGHQTYTFDSFECAIHALAPVCQHCGCRVIGHGVEASGTIFCCVHCANKKGVKGLEDRV